MEKFNLLNFIEKLGSSLPENKCSGRAFDTTKHNKSDYFVNVADNPQPNFVQNTLSAQSEKTFSQTKTIEDFGTNNEISTNSKSVEQNSTTEKKINDNSKPRHSPNAMLTILQNHDQKTKKLLNNNANKLTK